MTHTSLRRHRSASTDTISPALGDPNTAEALRRYWGRALGTVVLSFATVGLGTSLLYILYLSGGESGASNMSDAAAIAGISVFFGSGVAAALALLGGFVGLTRAARMSRWLRGHAWEQVGVRVGHSGNTAVVLLPVSGEVPTEPHVLFTWRWRLKRLQGLETVWVARPGGRCVVLTDPKRQSLYVARRTRFPFVSRLQSRTFALGMPPVHLG